MHSEQKLLELACQRIHALTKPACVKSSELRYIAVNEAYAKLFGKPVDDFHGCSSGQFDSAYPGSQREEAERRCVIFGDDAETILNATKGRRQYEVFAEQFITEDGGVYVFEYFEPEQTSAMRSAANDAANTQPKKAAAPKPEPQDLSKVLNEAIGAVDVVIYILSPEKKILYGNEKFKEFYSPFLGGVQVGDYIGKGLETVARDHVLCAGGHVPTQQELDDWVAHHVAEFDHPYFEKTGRLLNGKSIHIVNRRLSNGYTVAMRVDTTEATEREALLLKQKDELSLFKAVLDHVPVANFARDENNRMIYVNEAYCKLVGRPPEALIGSTLEDLFGDEAPKYAKINAEIEQAGESIEQEQIIPDANGVETPVVTKIGWLPMANGKKFLTGSMTDISTLKKREIELQGAKLKALSAEKDLRNIIESLEFGLIVVRQDDLAIEMTNEAVHGMWDAEELGSFEGRNFLDLVDYNYDNKRYSFTPDEYEEYKLEWIANIRSSSAMADRYLLTENGKHLIVRGTPIDAGRFMITYNDVSELRHREAEIDEARNQLAETGRLMNEALSSMQQGFIITDSRMNVLVSNDAASRLLSLPKELTNPGQSWTEIVQHCLDRGDFTQTMEELNNTWRKCRADGDPMQMFARIEGERWVRFEIKATPDDLRVVTMADITSERERQAELEKLVARAETADRAKSEFLANMSHEIRTPMNGILGMAELLAKSELDGKQQTFTDVIVKSGNALLTIINDVLDFSKIDAGQMKLRDGLFDPLDAIEDVATLLSAAASDKDVELIIKASNDLPSGVRGDVGRFRQIVTNLVGNAVKFTEKGHVLITLSPYGEGDDTGLRMEIADTGIGIPDDKLEAVFEKFSQVDGSSTRRHEGTGLGLAITAGLVDLFGGKMDVKSQIGKGTTFTVDLPFPFSSNNVRRDIPVKKPGARILVIDDNEVNRTILMEQLQGWGYDACAAEDGPQGLAVLEAAHGMQLPVDLIILDYHMPEMNGVDVARAIRTREWFDETPILFLTSMDFVGDEQRFADMNVQGHLMKPAKAQLLKSTVGKLLGRANTPLVSRGPASNVQAPDVTDTPSESQSSEAPSLEILIAEDNEVNQIVFTQILQQTRHSFHLVGNGQQAVENWESLKPSIILMDVSMPVMNGHEATRKIREIERMHGLPRTPIIGVTAHAQESDKELCLAAGMDDYMSKPISPERLQDKLRNWLPRTQDRKRA